MYSLSMEIMSFFSFQIRWVQWNPYFTYLLTRLSSPWYCNYPQYSVQRNYTENSQAFRRYMWSLFFKQYCSYLCYSYMLLYQPLFCGLPFQKLSVALIFWFFNSEINHVKGLMPSSNLIGYSLLENWWVNKWYQLCCLAHRGLREFLVSPKSIWSGTQVLEIFLATSVT